MRIFRTYLISVQDNLGGQKGLGPLEKNPSEGLIMCFAREKKYSSALPESKICTLTEKELEEKCRLHRIISRTGSGKIEHWLSNRNTRFTHFEASSEDDICPFSTISY
jgi:hypothetical protein